MKLQQTLVPLIPLLLLVGTAAYSAEPDNGQEAAIAAIKKLGGRVTLDRNKVVVDVRFRGDKVNDASLEHLKGLPKLQTLILTETKVTGAGLVLSSCFALFGGRN